MASVVILGAGLTGLSTAYHLEQNNFYDYAIFEREAVVGGLCRSETSAGFTFDYTGHLLHVNDAYFKDFLDEVMGLINLNTIDRRSFIYSHGVYTHYPFQTNLYGLPSDVITECIEGYVKRNTAMRNPKNFHEWVLKHFGAGIGKHFLFPYNKKLWTADARDMHHSWTGRFVPQTSLHAMIDGAIKPTERKQGYNHTFFYPFKYGIQAFPSALNKKIKNPVQLNHSVTSIDTSTQKVYFANGHVEPYQQLVSTLPLDVSLGLLTPPTRLNMRSILKKLRCNALVNFNLGIDRKDLSEKHWIYFPEKKYSFYRVGFWHNFAPTMTPQDCSALYGEFTYIPGTMTSQQVHATTRKAIEQTKELFGIADHEVITEKVLPISHAYVVYDAWRQQNLSALLQQLIDINIHSVGRFGAWKYSSMQEAILDGKETAAHILKQAGAMLIRRSRDTHPVFK